MSQTIRKIKLESPVQAIDEVISGDARALSANLQMLREKLFPPEAKKQLRKFSSGEAAKLIGVTDSYLRLLSTTGEGPCWEPPGRRTGDTSPVAPEEGRPRPVPTTPRGRCPEG